MRVRFVAPPWGKPEPTAEMYEAVEILGNGIWSAASVDFYAKREALVHAGKRAPKGMQQTLNSIIDERFYESGWDGEAGCYVKKETWVRVTFRHQMSLGSDIVDALKVCKKEGIKLAIILASSRETLNLISPNDAPGLDFFSKITSRSAELRWGT
jgi:hypothetical protein